MGVVCEVCGGVGFKHLLVQCSKCKNSARHRGIMKLDKEYISLAAHLSNQACKEVHGLSLSLPPLMKVTMISRWEALEALELTAETIGLYFFSDMMRPNKELDILVQHVTDHSMVLKYVVGSTALLIFSSILLPERCRTFQGKHYLWGLFKPRMCASKADTPGEQKDCASHIAEKKVQQHYKVQGDTLDQETPILKHIMQSNRQPSRETGLEIGTETDPGERRGPCSNSETAPPKLFGLVVAQTPRSEQFIRELENEGAVVFAVNGLGKPGHLKV